MQCVFKSTLPGRVTKLFCILCVVLGTAKAINAAPPTILQLPKNDSIVQTSVQIADSSSLFQDTSTTVDSIQATISKETVTAPPFIRSVLYLGGGESSPWFYLGVLYALRDYRIPVDSVAGSSWGAWVGALWTAGWSLDEMQRLMTDPAIAPYLSEDRLFPSSPDNHDFHLPIAKNGPPAIEALFSLKSDSAGYVKLISRSLDPDTAAMRYTLFRLRLQESLQREPSGKTIPFSVIACGQKLSNAPNDILQTLPLENNKASGDYCALVPVLAITPNTLSIVALPFPTRAGPPSQNPWRETLLKAALERLQNSTSSLVILRPHSLNGLNTPTTWMQAGYKSVEVRLGDFTPLASRLRDSPPPQDSISSRFRYFPSFDSISAEFYSHISTFWPEKDTGFVAPQKFMENILQSPLYDSVALSLEYNGDLMISAEVSPVLDFTVGGFGSNVTGPNAYGSASFRYVNQFEYLLGAAAFVGANSYGVRPEMRLSGMWQGNWDFSIGGDFSKWEPLRGYFHNEASVLRIYSEKRSDFNAGLHYTLDSLGVISVQVTLGESVFETENTAEFGELKTRSLFPRIGFTQKSEDYVPWFGNSGHNFNIFAGFRSVNFAVNGATDAPLYFSSTAEAQKFFAPMNHISLGFGATAGINIRREEGEGYEYPSSLNVSMDTEEEVAITNWYRLHMNPTPWSTEWPFSEMGSHHYALARASLGLHQGPIGAWIFAAYMRDFEENPSLDYEQNRLILEPTLRFSRKSIDVRCGMSRMVDFGSVKELKDVKNYQFFFKVGNEPQ